MLEGLPSYDRYDLRFCPATAPNMNIQSYPNFGDYKCKIAALGGRTLLLYVLLIVHEHIGLNRLRAQPGDPTNELLGRSSICWQMNDVYKRRVVGYHECTSSSLRVIVCNKHSLLIDLLYYGLNLRQGGPNLKLRRNAAQVH